VPHEKESAFASGKRYSNSERTFREKDLEKKDRLKRCSESMDGGVIDELIY